MIDSTGMRCGKSSRLIIGGRRNGDLLDADGLDRPLAFRIAFWIDDWTCRDLLHHVEPPGHLADQRKFAVNGRRRAERDVEATARRAGVSVAPDADGPFLVLEMHRRLRLEEVANVAEPRLAGAERAAAFHKVYADFLPILGLCLLVDDAIEAEPLVIADRHQRDEVADVVRRPVGLERDLERARLRLDGRHERLR